MTIPYRPSLAAALAALLLFAAPVAAGQQASRAPGAESPPNQGPKPPATGERVMVSTQLPIVTETALDVLRDGGNAVDAMITAVFLQHVVDFHQVSHFGTMSAIYYEAGTGEYHVISAVSKRPRADRCGEGDPSQVAIGGVVKGLAALADRFGTLEWEEYLQPAIAAAEEGVLVTSFMYGVNYAMFEGGDSLIKDNPAAMRAYMPDGHLVPVGERWKRPALAGHLRSLAEEGADYMYTGKWGRKFVDAARDKGYCVSTEDMASYDVEWQEPARFSYRGYDMVGSPPPDTGGPVVGFNLSVLENFDLGSMGHYSEDPDTLEILARTFQRVSAETGGSIRDPLNYNVPLELWYSDEYGALAARFVRDTMLREGIELRAPEGSETARLGDRSAAPAFAAADEAGHPDLGSNHNVIADGDGNWFSMLHTGHGGAPGVFIDGVRATGSGASADTMGPGRRLVLPITAVMLERQGEDGPFMAMGTPGSPPQPITEVLVNLIDFGMDPLDAVDAPRFWAGRYDDDVDIRIESRISAEVREGMTSRGLKLDELGFYNWHTGSIQIVWRDEDGMLHGVTDPRRLGMAKGF
ncbi:MAG: gamma-glutamyltransferase [Acidobacteriota bacterium]